MELKRSATQWDRLDATIARDGFNIHVVAERGRYNRRPKKIRYYVDGFENVDYSDLMVTDNWPNDPALTPEFKRRDRIELKHMRAVLEPGMAILRAEMPGAASEKVSYSRTAGCSCGCSPGFIGGFPRKIEFDGDTYWTTDVWVTKKA